eukprot:250537-Prymnesium_polylepis.1
MHAWSCYGSSLVSRVACCPLVVAAHGALSEEAKIKRRTACVPLTVMCILSKNKTRVCLMGPDQDPRDVKRVTGA